MTLIAGVRSPKYKPLHVWSMVIEDPIDRKSNRKAGFQTRLSSMYKPDSACGAVEPNPNTIWSKGGVGRAGAAFCENWTMTLSKCGHRTRRARIATRPTPLLIRGSRKDATTVCIDWHITAGRISTDYISEDTALICCFGVQPAISDPLQAPGRQV